MWILTNWRTIMGVLATLMLAVGVELLTIYYLHAESAKALTTQKSQLIQQCQTLQSQTKELNDELEKSRNSIAIKLSNLNKLHRQDQLFIASQSNIRPDTSGQHAGSWGVIDPVAYNTYTAACESLRSNLIVCNKQLDDERK